jgi:two-component system, NarL family, response regulator NreC
MGCQGFLFESIIGSMDEGWHKTKPGEIRSFPQIATRVATAHTAKPLEISKKEAVQTFERPSLARALKILLADDHQIVLQGLRAVLEREDFTVIGEATDGREAVRMALQSHPDVAILDIAMPEMSGIEAAVEIKKAVPEIKTILLTMHTEDQYILEALQAGIPGYILKSRASSEVVDAVREVSNGGTFLSPVISQRIVEAYLDKSGAGPPALTPRECQVLRLVAEGKTTKQIASLLGVSVKTADSHRTNVMHKLNVHSVADVVRYAIRRGLVRL